MKRVLIGAMVGLVLSLVGLGFIYLVAIATKALNQNILTILGV